VAYDLDRAGWRIFRVDRVDAPQPTGARATPRELPAPDAAAYVTDTLYSGVPVHTAVATLHAPVERVRGRIGDGTADLEPIDAGRCLLRSHTDTLEWLAFALLRLGCEFEVHEPPELREHLRALAGRLGRAAGAG
jgi:predicted DNA-binding transcriptional regulator YafY